MNEKAKAEKQQRLAEALRANLRRRKEAIGRDADTNRAAGGGMIAPSGQGILLEAGEPEAEASRGSAGDRDQD